MSTQIQEEIKNQWCEEFENLYLGKWTEFDVCKRAAREAFFAAKSSSYEREQLEINSRNILLSNLYKYLLPVYESETLRNEEFAEEDWFEDLGKELDFCHKAILGNFDLSEYGDFKNQNQKLQERISFLEECNERQKTYYDENIELRYQLNNSMNYHCPHFLSNESGTVSCHVDFISQIEKRDQLIEQVYPWIKDPSAIPFVRVRLQWIKQVEELRGEK